MSASVMNTGMCTFFLLGQLGLEQRLSIPLASQLFAQTRCYAARKGYREKKRRAMVKKVVEKKAFTPIKQKLGTSDQQRILRRDESKYPLPTDDVWYDLHYRTQIYPFAEAVQCHRETHHPTVYNEPEALLNVRVELDMKAAKKNRLMENFADIVLLPHIYDKTINRKVLAFAKTLEIQDEAYDAGADKAGGIELIKCIQAGEVLLAEYEYAVAHINITQELVQLKGLLKKIFPSQKQGTAGTNIGQLVKRVYRGVEYKSSKDEYEKDFGWIDQAFGTLNMDTAHLEENLQALTDSIMRHHPKRGGLFITKMMLTSAPTKEKFLIDHTLYTGEKEGTGTEKKKEEEEVDGIIEESAIEAS